MTARTEEPLQASSTLAALFMAIGWGAVTVLVAYLLNWAWHEGVDQDKRDGWIVGALFVPSVLLWFAGIVRGVKNLEKWVNDDVC